MYTMKIYDSRITVAVLACICFMQFTFVLLISGEKNIGNYVLTPSVSNTNSTSSETIMVNENDRESSYASMRGSLSNQSSTKESLENTIEELPFHKKYSNKTLTELLHEVTLIMKEMNYIYHKKQSVDTNSFIARLNEISPYIIYKAVIDEDYLYKLLVNLDQRIQRFALQNIFIRPYIEMNSKTSEEDLKRMYKEVSEKYHGYYGIAYSSAYEKHIKLQFFTFSKMYMIEVHLNSGNYFKSCKWWPTNDYEYCYNINNIPHRKCLTRYIHLGSFMNGNVCKRVSPVTCLINHGGCSRNADCYSTDDDILCTCKEGYIGDGIECSNKYIDGPISHLDLYRYDPYERLENSGEAN